MVLALAELRNGRLAPGALPLAASVVVAMALSLALARCARALGTADAPSGTPVPRFACDARQHMALSTHQEALGHMLEWGIADPARDARTEVAYDLALRRASIASAR